ncbi:MAG TPA: murein biosynthesis integral membrane protein MurJ [Mycobacteriales bacterium]|nr:murein biosynthesis integral membrane protein MurJ [Mycobacteriales bacterium]
MTDTAPLTADTAPASGRAALARSGVAMATGTLASRGTGFIRTVVIAYALGVGGVNNAYTVANTVPNALYDLLLGGVLSALVVPLLVQAAHDDADDGEAFAQRLITIVAVVLTAVAILAVLIAPWVISAYAHNARPAQKALAVTFARFFLPQLLFYGLGAVLGAILNIRGSFVAPMWAPVLNNLVVIGCGISFAVITHSPPRPGHLSHAQILVLAIGTTAGVVVQTVALLPALRQVGLRLKARWDWGQAGLRRAGPFAGWVLGYVITNQLGYVVISDLAEAIDHGRGELAIYSYGYLLFSLPYAVVAVTVITALFPAMSRSGTAGDDAAVAQTLSEGLSLAGVVLVPATLLMVVLGPPIAVLVLAHGQTTHAGAALTGRVLIAFAAGLVPFSAFQMQLRAWLAVHDSRTPMLVNLWITALNLAADVLLYAVLPSGDRVVGLAAGYSISYAVGTVVFAVKLRRRLVATQRTFVIRTHVRLIVAALLAAVPTELLSLAIRRGVGTGTGGSLAAIAVAAPAGIATFLLVVRRMRVPELGQLVALLPIGRFRA